MAFNTHNVVQAHLCGVSRHFHHPKRKPSSQINAHSPLPTHLLFVFIYLLCVFCIYAIMPFPHNLMQPITSSSFKHFLHEASRIPMLPGFPYPDLWTLEVQGPVLYLSLSLSLLSPWLTHHGFKFHPCLPSQDSPQNSRLTHPIVCLTPLHLACHTCPDQDWAPDLPHQACSSWFMSSPPSKSSSRKPYSLHPWHFSFFP